MPFQGEYRETETVTVTLAQFSVTVRFQQQRQVGEFRHRVFPSESTVKQHMKRSRRQPFFTTNNVRNLHQMVIYNICQVISGKFISRLIQHLIVQDRRVDNHFTANQVVYMYVFIRFNLETDYILLSFCNQTIHFLLTQSQRVSHWQTGRSIVLEIGYFFAFSIQFFRSIKGNIGFSVFQQYLHILLINITTLRLAVRAILSAETYAFIKRDA